MTDIVPAPDVALSSQFPTNADRVAGVFNAKAAAWADSSRAMAADMDAAAKSAATNAQAAEERAVAADQSAQDANQYKLDAQAARDSAQGAAVIVGRFDKLYLGPKAEFPSLDNEGGALQIGAEFFHAVLGARYSWSGTEWLIGTNVTAGVSQVNGMTGVVTLQPTDIAPAATTLEMQEGAETGYRSMSPLLVKQAISALAPRPTAATQAQMEAASASNVFLTPQNAKHHPSAAKAWGKIDFSGGIASAVVSYNISSITDGADGRFQVNFSVPFSSSNYAILVTNLSGNEYAPMVSNGSRGGAQTASSFAVWTFITSTGSEYIPPGTFFACFGDQ